MSRCIFCGYCELACPFDAITLGNDFEISEYNRDDLIYTKDMLLAPPVKRVPVADADLYDTPIPYYKDNSVVANFLVWVVWFVAAFACLASALAVVSFRNPFYSALVADREPRLARRALPAALRRVRRGGPGARLRRRGDGDVPLRDRLPRRPHRRVAVVGRAVVAVVGAVLAGGAILAEVMRRRRARGRAASSRSRRTSSASFGSPGVDRTAVPHRSSARLRGDVDRAARRRRRRRRARLARAHEEHRDRADART